MVRKSYTPEQILKKLRFPSRFDHVIKGISAASWSRLDTLAGGFSLTSSNISAIVIVEMSEKWVKCSPTCSGQAAYQHVRCRYVERLEKIAQMG